jgi:hypothetical protein
MSPHATDSRIPKTPKSAYLFVLRQVFASCFMKTTYTTNSSQFLVVINGGFRSVGRDFGLSENVVIGRLPFETLRRPSIGCWTLAFPPNLVQIRALRPLALVR